MESIEDIKIFSESILSEEEQSLLQKINSNLSQNKTTDAWENPDNLLQINTYLSEADALDLDKFNRFSEFMKSITLLKSTVNQIKNNLQSTDGKIKIPQISFQKWFDERNKNSDIVIEETDLYENLKYKPIDKKDLLFQPQMTLGFPVDSTVTIVNALYQPTSGNDKEDLNWVLNGINNIPNLNSKIKGFLFIYLLTLKKMQPRNIVEHQLIEDIKQRFEKGQADVKGLLPIMSRRPFSEIFSEVNGEQYNLRENLYNMVQDLDNFSYVNYGEEILNDAKKRVNLKESLVPFIQKEFYNKNQDTIDYLLENGVLSTSIIRHLYIPNPLMPVQIPPSNIEYIVKNYLQNIVKTLPSSIESIFKNYLQDAINSLHNGGYRYVYENEKIKKIKSSNDILSPPHFLSNDDAMGFYKNRKDLKGKNLLEFRMIKNYPGEKKQRTGLFMTKCDNMREDIEDLLNYITKKIQGE